MRSNLTDRLDELNSYLSELFDTTVDISDSDLRIVSNQEGCLARWDQSSNDWASNQMNGNLLWAVLTDADGVLAIDGDEMVLDAISDCDTETDVDFSGTQCTAVEEWEYDICQGICGPNGNIHDQIHGFVYTVESILTDFELSSGPYLRYDANLDTGTFEWRFRRMQVLADEADMNNLYYDIVGNLETSSPEYPSVEYDTDSTRSYHTGDDIRGGCGFGEAVRLTREISPKTTKGSAPTIPTCEQDL